MPVHTLVLYSMQLHAAGYDIDGQTVSPGVGTASSG